MDGARKKILLGAALIVGLLLFFFWLFIPRDVVISQETAVRIDGDEARDVYSISYFAQNNSHHVAEVFAKESLGAYQPYASRRKQVYFQSIAERENRFLLKAGERRQITGAFSVEKARYAFISAAVSTIRIQVRIEKINETVN